MIPFYIICTLIIFAPLTRGAVHPWAATLIQILVLVSAITLTLGNAKIPKTPMTRPIALILILCTASFMASPHKPVALEGMLMLITYIMAFYITITCVRTRQQQRIIVTVIITTAVILSIIGILKRFDINPFTFWTYPDIGNPASTSVSGPYVNRNHLAGFLEMAIPFVIILFITRQRRLEAKLGLLCITLFLVITQAFTLSRGGWISAITAILFLSAVLLGQKNFAHKKTILTTFTAVAIITLFILSSLPVVERITTLTRQDPVDNIEGRIRCWKGTIALINNNLALGTGPNTFAQAYPAWQIPGHAVLRRYAHNDYLHFTAETGIFFIPVLLYTLFVFFRTGFDNLNSRSRQKKGITLGAMAAILAILVHSFSDFNLNIPANALVFTIIAALVFNQSEQPEKTYVP